MSSFPGQVGIKLLENKNRPVGFNDMDEENIEFLSLPQPNTGANWGDTTPEEESPSENDEHVDAADVDDENTDCESSCSSFAEEGLDIAAKFCSAIDSDCPVAETDGKNADSDADELGEKGDVVVGQNQNDDEDSDEGDDNGDRTWSYIPVEPWVHTADPTARVFDDTLYLYTSCDSVKQCGAPYSEPHKKKKGSQKFCMPGYRVYSCDKSALYRADGWKAHGSILREEAVPWVYKGRDQGYSGTARMWAPDCIRGDDGLYYLFFPAPQRTYVSHVSKVINRIGVATSAHPAGPFIPRDIPIKGSIGIDPSVLRLKDGRWTMFTSGGGEIWLQYLDAEFKRVISKRFKVAGLENGYKEGPFAIHHEDSVMLYYSLSTPGKYSILQGKAYDSNNPIGYEKNITVIHPFDGRTNHASIVPDYKGKTWAFFHRHTEAQDEDWSARRVVFAKASINDNGNMHPIAPRFY